MDLAAVARALNFAAALICIGAIPARSIFRRSWGRPEDAQAHDAAQTRLTWIVFTAALILPLAAFVALRTQAFQLVDEGETLGGAQFTLALASGWGTGWKAQAAASLLAVIAWIPRRGRPMVGPRLAPIAALALAATLPLSGHARTVPIGEVAGVLALALHLIGGGLWLGNLALLTVAGWGVDPDRSGRRVATLFANFSSVALVGAAIIALSGAVVGWQTVGSLGALTASPYGRMLLFKLATLVGVAALGVWNWKVVQPRLALGTGAPLIHRSAAIELTLGAVLLLLTALLVVLPAPGLK